MNRVERRRAPALVLGVLLGLPSLAAQACGPDFPWSMIEHRRSLLSQLPSGSFALSAASLANQRSGLTPGSSSGQDEERYYETDQQRAHLETRELGAALAQRVQQLRQASDAQQVEHDGADLPAELRLYLAGAVAFAQADDDVAIDYFQRVLQLPADQRRLRSTWAAYSLGRALARRDQPEHLTAGETPSAERQAEHLAAARAAFAQVRQLRRDGFADVWGLASASLGEEAALDLRQDDWSAAIQSYAEQLRVGDDGGLASLQELARQFLSQPEARQQALLRQPQVRRLLTAYLFGQSHDDLQPAWAQALVGQLQQGDLSQQPDLDRLAALSYQQGDYASARHLLGQAGDSGLAWWLRARLALRDGDDASAESAYAQAAKAFPANEEWGVRVPDNDREMLVPRCRAEGEQAVLALHRGDYLDAFDLLIGSGSLYWRDSARIAERVLSVRELQTYVDAHLHGERLVRLDGQPAARFGAEEARRLRALLGRRLLREGHFEQAPAYFDDPQLRQAASDYAHWREQAERAWSAVGRAEALYQAARLARHSGLELLGYELAEDYAIWGGNYHLDDAGPQADDPLRGPDEALRWQASAPRPERRFHYRYSAAELANASADLLSPRSQAFAAVLCHASGWLIDRDPAQAALYYRRYIDHGALLDWTGGFARACPEPDFAAASRRAWQDRADALRTLLPHRRTMLGSGLLLLLAGALFWHWRRRQPPSGAA